MDTRLIPWIILLGLWATICVSVGSYIHDDAVVGSGMVLGVIVIFGCSELLR